MDAVKHTPDRALELLEAARDLIDLCDEVQWTEVDYDGTTCDGACLRDDIQNFLDAARATGGAA